MVNRTTTSLVEVGAIRALGDNYDVAILGGGLAGLTLAVQLKRARPETSVLVLEKREGPAPLAAFKVGESTVPAGAHYFADVVGMRDHLAQEQLIKLGLRFFPSLHGNHDITKRPEKGPPDFPPGDTYQLDRGLFENALARRAREMGVDLVQGARVREVRFEADNRSLSVEQGGELTSTNARWLVDASGRASLLKRQLGLGTDCGHHINSVWFRLRGGLDLEQWGEHDSAWMGRMARPGIRKYSTNHLLGEGYWIWLIPLSTGPISIGVCADPRFHPFEEISSFERMLEWMRRHEPQLADAVESRLENVEDFLRVEDFAYGVEQTFSADRWALVGEAAAFCDPFFSPGSDFIGYGNTFTTDLISRDLSGEDVAERTDYYNTLYQRAFEFTISRHRDTYPVFGNPGVALEMLYWMTPASHSGLTLLFEHDKLSDLEFMKSVDVELRRYFRLNITMHEFFRQWSRLARPEPEMVGPELRGGGPPIPDAPGGPPIGAPTPIGDGPGTPPGAPPTGLAPPLIVRVTLRGFSALENDLDDDQLRTEFREQVRDLEQLAVEIFRRAASVLPTHPPDDTEVDPYSISLNPPRWEPQGMLADSTT